MFERHHRKRRRDGGDTLANIAYLCGGPQGCHSYVHTHPAEARKFGWIVSVTKEPDQTPMLVWDKTWVQFDNQGNAHPLFDHAPE